MSPHNYIVFKNFITEQEADDVFQWTLENSIQPEFRYAGYPGTIRKVTRASTVNYWPNCVYSVQKKVDEQIKTIFNIDDIESYKCERLGLGNSFYAAICNEGDTCAMHLDPRWIKNRYTLHFNVIFSDHQDGHSVLGKDVVEVYKTDAILFLASEVSHGTTKLTGTTPRVFYCFGYTIPFAKVNMFDMYLRAYSSIG